MSTGRRPLEDRELDAILERLDRLADSIDGVARRLDALESVDRMSREFGHLARALESLAYAALGARGPSVRRPPE